LIYRSHKVKVGLNGKYPKNEKKITADAINPLYSVYVYESVNLDDGDSALVESPFLF